MFKRICILILIFWCAGFGFGEKTELTQEDFIRARTEVDSVVELGRLFYNIAQWSKAKPLFALTKEQKETMYSMCKRIGTIKRWDPSEAADYLSFMLETLLTDSQLEQNDLFRIKWDERQRLQLRAQQGPGQGRGRIQMLKWINGKDFNPLLSNIMDIGLAFQDIYKDICKVCGKEYIITNIGDDKAELEAAGFDFEQRPGYTDEF